MGVFELNGIRDSLNERSWGPGAGKQQLLIPRSTPHLSLPSLGPDAVAEAV